jgi:hypothetical protein
VEAGKGSLPPHRIAYKPASLAAQPLSGRRAFGAPDGSKGKISLVFCPCVLDGREQETLSRLLGKLREGDPAKFYREMIMQEFWEDDMSH